VKKLVDEETRKAELKAEDELSKYVHRLMEKHKLSPASMKVVLDNVAENINPYVSTEELKEQ